MLSRTIASNLAKQVLKTSTPVLSNSTPTSPTATTSATRQSVGGPGSLGQPSKSTMPPKGARTIVTSTKTPPEDSTLLGWHGSSEESTARIAAEGVDLSQSGKHGEPALGEQTFSFSSNKETAQSHASKAARDAGEDGHGALTEVRLRAGDEPNSIDTLSRPAVPEIAMEMRAANPDAHQMRTSQQADGSYDETALLPKATTDKDVHYYLTPEKKD